MTSQYNDDNGSVASAMPVASALHGGSDAASLDGNSYSAGITSASHGGSVAQPVDYGAYPNATPYVAPNSCNVVTAEKIPCGKSYEHNIHVEVKKIEKYVSEHALFIVLVLLIAYFLYTKYNGSNRM